MDASLPQDPGRIARNVAAMRAQGANEHDIEAYLTQHEGLTPSAPTFNGAGTSGSWGGEPKRTPLYNAANTFAQGASLGFGDEVNAALYGAKDALTGKDSFKHSYQQNVQSDREGLRDFQNQHPVAAPLLQIGGGVAAAMAAAPLAGLGKAAQGMSAGQKLLKGATVGFDLGAANGFGSSEGDLSSRVKGAAYGGALGAAGGAIAVPLAGAVSSAAGLAGRGVRPVMEKAAQVFGGDERLGVPMPMPRVMSSAAGVPPSTLPAQVSASGDDRASELLIKRLQRAGLSPEEALAHAQSLPAGKPVSVMEVAGDMSDPVRQLGKLVARTPSMGAAQLKAAIAARSGGLPTARRVLGDAGDAMGVQRTNLVDHAEKQIAARSAAASPWYEAAMQQNPPVPTTAGSEEVTLGDLLKRPSVKSAMQFHNDVALERGEKPIALPADGQEGAVPMEALHRIKVKLDDMIGYAKSNGQFPDGTAATRDKLRAVQDTKNQLLGIMDSHAPEYAQARQIFAGHSSLMDAAKEGRNFLSAPIDELRSEFPKLTPGEQEQYLLSALSGPVRDKVFKSPGVNLAKTITGTPDLQERLHAILPEPSKLQAFLDAMKHEYSIAATNQAIPNGSDTAANLANAMDAGHDLTKGVLTNLASLNVKGAAHTIVHNAMESRAARLLQGVNETTANALAPKLSAGMASREDLMKMLQELVDRSQQAKTSPFTPQVSGRVGATMGQLGAQRP